MVFDPKKLGEEADQLIQNLNQQQAQAAEAEEPAEAAVEDQAVEMEADAIADDEVVAIDDQGTSDHTNESPEAEPQAATDSEAIAELRKQIEASEQKWRVLQGMINKKDQELEAMRELFAQVESTPPAAEEQKLSVPQATPQLTQKDVEEYGSELVDMVKRAAQDVSSNTTAEILQLVEERLKKLEGSVQTVEQSTARTAQEVFFDSLTKSVPNWQQLNTDETFLNWLNQPEPMVGAPRLQLLQDAVAKQDVRRAASFFNTFEQLMGVSEEPASTEEPAETEASAPSEKLAKKVVPGRGRAATPKGQGDKMEWDRKSIAKLYDDKRLGRISPKEFDKLERDLFRAQSEGRIAV